MLISYRLYDAETTPSDQDVVKVERTDSGWNITFREMDFSFVDKDVSFYPDMANVRLSYHNIFLNWASGNASDKCGFYSSLFKHRGWDGTHIGSIFVDSTGESHFFTRFPVDSKGVEPTIISYDISLGTRSEDAFLRALPEECGFAEWNKRHRAKINNLAHISLNDSIAALEAQVDLQNRIIMKLAAGESCDDDVALLKSATSGVTVDCLHEDSKLVETISRQKSHIRSVQRQYFEERGGATNADVSA